MITDSCQLPQDRSLFMTIDAQAFVSKALDLIADMRPLDEVIDSVIDTCTGAEKVAILDAFGDVDLSEPLPDLSMGWSRVRGQLAYNALAAEVARQLVRR